MTDQTAATDKILAEDDFTFVSFDEATAPTQQGYYQLYLNSWWIYSPERGLAFFNPRNKSTGRRRHQGYGIPQRNSREDLLRYTFETVPRTWLADVQFMERVYVRVRDV